MIDALRECVIEFNRFDASAVPPRLTGPAALAAAIAAYEHWLADGNALLPELIDAAFRRLGDGCGAMW
ncbi:acyl-CoA-like ligand-binding transcription factor [Streptomyces nodosus]